MGICGCTRNNIIYPNEINVPSSRCENDNFLDNKPDCSNHSPTNHKVIEEKNTTAKPKQKVKSFLKFSFASNNSTLSSALKDINKSDPQKQITKQMSLTSQDNKFNTKKILNSINLHNLSNQHSLSLNKSNENFNINNLNRNNSNASLTKDLPQGNISQTPKMKKTRTLLANENKKDTSLSRFKDGCVSNANYNFTCSSHVVTDEESAYLKEILSKHFIFMEYNSDTIMKLVEALDLYEIENDNFIFKEGEQVSGFYIIKSGIVEIKTKVKATTLEKGNTFGELSLFTRRSLRTYAAIATSRTSLFCLTYDKYREVLKEVQLINDFEKNNKKKNKYKNDILKYFLLNNLPDKTKENLMLLATYHEFQNNNTNLILSSNKEGNKPIFHSQNTLFFPVDGELTETFNNSSAYSYKIIPSKCAGIKHLLYKGYRKSEFIIKVTSDTCICIVLPEKAFIESLGINYAFELLFTFFYSNLDKSVLISKLTPIKNKSKMDIMYYYSNLYVEFVMKNYSANDVVYQESVFENKKHVLVLQGELINSKTKKVIVKQGEFYGDEVINTSEK